MSNKKLLSVLLVLPSILLCLSACSSPAADNGNQAPNSPGLPAIDYGYDLYEKSYAKATDAQKKQLESIQTNTTSYGYAQEYTKQILIIMGELPADTPQITLAQAQAICKDIQERNLSFSEFTPALIAAFNEIAGAPDYNGGSGMRVIDYYLNDRQTELLRLTGISVLYINKEADIHDILCKWEAN